MVEERNASGARGSGWLGWAGPPYHSFGILPFLLGTVLAWRLSHAFHLPVFLLSLFGIALVMVATHYTGEYANRVTLTARIPLKARFSSPSAGFWDAVSSSPRSLKMASASFLLAAFTALGLQFGLHTGPFTLLLGFLGALPGFCYATRSCPWLNKGWQEWVNSFCCSWLAMAAGFYVQTGQVASCIHSMAVPVGLSLLNVILLNEFTGHVAPPDGEIPLLARLGKTKGMILYVLCSVLSWFWMVGSLNAGVPRKALYLYLPVLALSVVISLMMAGKKYEHHFLLEWLCGLTIAVYLGTTLAYLLAFI